MKALIISIDHYLQLVESSNDNAGRREKKTALRALLLKTLRDHRFTAIFEESDPKEVTIAYELANAQNPKVPWNNIIMTPDERQAAGIREALDDRPWRLSPDMSYQIEKRIPEDDVREDYFTDQILRNAGRNDEVVLVLLGDMHTAPVARKLQSYGVVVEIDNRLVPEKRWEE